MRSPIHAQCTIHWPSERSKEAEWIHRDLDLRRIRSFRRSTGVFSFALLRQFHGPHRRPEVEARRGSDKM